MSKVPAKEADITKEWLEEVLSVDGVIVDDVTVTTDSIKGDGFNSQLRSISANCSINDVKKEYKLIMKMYPEAEQHSFLVKHMRVFYREIEFYTKILPDIKKMLQEKGVKLELPFPKVYYAKMNVEETAAVLVMDDLRCTGHAMNDKFKGADLDHIKFAFNELGKLHAIGFVINKLDTSKYTETGCMETPTFLAPIFPTMFDGAMTILEKYPEYQDLLPKIAAKKLDAAKLFTKSLKPVEQHNTLCHGDFWNNNMMFQYNSDKKPTSVKLLDLQNCHFSHFAVDVCYYIGTTIPAKYFAANYDTIIHCYYDSLMSYLQLLGSNYSISYEECCQEIRSYMDYGFLCGCLLLPNTLRQADEIEDMSEMSTDLNTAFTDIVEQLTSKSNETAARRLGDLARYIADEHII